MERSGGVRARERGKGKERGGEGVEILREENERVKDVEGVHG